MSPAAASGRSRPVHRSAKSTKLVTWSARPRERTAIMAAHHGSAPNRGVGRPLSQVGVDPRDAAAHQGPHAGQTFRPPESWPKHFDTAIVPWPAMVAGSSNRYQRGPGAFRLHRRSHRSTPPTIRSMPSMVADPVTLCAWGFWRVRRPGRARGTRARSLRVMVALKEHTTPAASFLIGQLHQRSLYAPRNIRAHRLQVWRWAVAQMMPGAADHLGCNGVGDYQCDRLAALDVCPNLRKASCSGSWLSSADTGQWCPRSSQ